MAAAMITDRGLRKKLSQEAAREPEKATKKAPKRKSGPKKTPSPEQNNNQSKKMKFAQTGDTKADLMSAYQPWVIQTYGDLAKTKTITLRKYARILRTLRGEECNSSDSSKFRFWVKAKGFHLGKPPGYDAKPADGIVCRYSVLDVDDGPEAVERCSGSANDPALYIPTVQNKNSSCQDPVYRKVAIVENFFDIIYTVHVDLEGRAGKHAGQKRTYRTITETYAFLPREAVTRFLMGCTECQRRPRSLSPSSVLPTPSPSPTPLPSTITNGFHQIPAKLEHLGKHENGEIVGKNWESEIDASQHSMKGSFKDVFKGYIPSDDVYSLKENGVDLSSKSNYNGIINYMTTKPKPKDVDLDSIPKNFSNVFRTENDESCSSVKSKESRVELKQEETPSKKKPYNPLDVCNLTSKDPPKSRSPKRRHLHPMYNEKNFSKPWSPSSHSVFSHRWPSEYFGKGLNDMEIDYSIPITTTYMKHMRNLSYAPRCENKETLNPETSDIDRDDDHYSGVHMKDADKLKLMLLAWNIHTQNRGRNGEAMDGVGGETNMAELWASYHSALGLAGARAPARSLRDQPSPVMLGSSIVDPGGNHDETSSSAGNGKEDDDALGSDDESDDRLDPQQHDPERLKAFNMFVRLFVDENLDRIVPISKQPKEKIQAIIDSCTRQFPEFAERARKRIRTYLKSCRRNKKVRGDLPAGNSTPAWDAAIRPTPAHLTSVQAEQILAQACENESHNAKRMRLGLEPVSQPMPTSTPGIAIDTTASTASVTHPLLGLYNSSLAAAQLQGASPGLGGKIDPSNPNVPSLLSASIQNSLENGICLNNNTINKGQNDIGGKNSSSRTSTPSVPSVLGDFSSSLVAGTGAGLVGGAGALLSSLGAPPPAAMAAYQSALFSAAMAAGAHHTQGLNFGGLGVTSMAGNGPTDLSMKNSSSSLSQASFPNSLSSTNAVAALGLNSASGISHSSQNSTKPLLLSHKLSTVEMAAVKQLITGYRESAAFLLRSADELETLLLQQP